MGFVIKLSNGVNRWVTSRNGHQARVGPRDRAKVFASEEDAVCEIEGLIAMPKWRSFIYTVEPTSGAKRIAKELTRRT